MNFRVPFLGGKKEFLILGGKNFFFPQCLTSTSTCLVSANRSQKHHEQK